MIAGQDSFSAQLTCFSCEFHVEFVVGLWSTFCLGDGRDGDVLLLVPLAYGDFPPRPPQEGESGDFL